MIPAKSGARQAWPRHFLFAAIVVVAIGGGAVSVPFGGARAQQSIAEFYRGKQVKFVIRSAPGGGYDLYSRLIGTYMVRHIPGNPTMVALNMPGGGGIEAANYMAEIAPRDGTYLTMAGQSLPLDRALGFTPTFKADLGSFGWIGNITDSNILTYTWRTSPVKTIEDAMRLEGKMGGTGAGSNSTWLPLLYNKLLGTKFKIINGYQSASEVKLAMSRGEVDGYSASAWAAVLSSSPELVQDHLIRILVQLGLRKEKDLPDVPLASELARNPQDRAILDFIAKGMAVGRPVATTPGVAAERLVALRKAFDETLVDPDFLAAAAMEGAEINPMDGATLQNIIDELMGAPPEFKNEVKAALPDRS